MEATREIQRNVADETSGKSKTAKGNKTSSEHAGLARTRSNSDTELPAKQPAGNKEQRSFRSQHQTMSCSSYFATVPTSRYLQDRVRLPWVPEVYLARETWPTPETAQEKPLAPKVSADRKCQRSDPRTDARAGIGHLQTFGFLRNLVWQNEGRR